MSREIEEIRRLYDEHQRIFADEPGAVREATEEIVRYVQSDWAFVLYSRLTATSAANLPKRQLEELSTRVDRVEWKHFSWDLPPTLPDHLLRAGFVGEEEEALMVLPLDAAGDLGNRGAAPSTLSVKVVHAVDELADAETVNRAVWGDSRPIVSIVEPLWRISSGLASIHVAYLDGRPVSYGRIHFPRTGPFASLWGGATVPDSRGRGAYSALVASRVDEARRRGYEYLTVDADFRTSRPILSRRGFIEIGRTRPFTWTRDDLPSGVGAP